jgi:predicted glycosyltransferase
VRIWIDIENPPQVQYLLPFKRAFEKTGAETVVTARDYGIALDLLRSEGAEFSAIGASYGKGKARKAAGLLRRTQALSAFFRGRSRPDALVHAGRASALVARRMRIPNFSISDYEFADLTFERLTGSFVVFPEVIDPQAYLGKGIPRERLIPYRGLKEHISFSGVDVESVAPYLIDGLQDDGLVRVLFRPPAEESHYYRDASGDLTLQLLAFLANETATVVLFSPRYPRQAEYLQRFRWVNPPVLLEEAIPFVPLLKASDLVVSSGGTMVREAAYLGIPAYSIYRGELGGVDRHLHASGRLRLLSSAADFEALEFARRGPIDVLAGDPSLLDELADAVLGRVSAPRLWPAERAKPS